MRQITCEVSGKVQAVGFRAYVQESALSLGLTGYVSNRKRGSVFVLAQGAPQKLQELIEHLHKGSVASVVEGVSVHWENVQEIFEDFTIKW